MRRLEERGVLLDDALEQAHAGLAGLRDRRVRVFWKHLHGSQRKAVGLDTALEDAYALLAPGDHVQNPELRHVPFADAGEGADRVRGSRLADFLARDDQAYAEGRAVLQAGLRHVHVARLEDAQRQPPARKEHGVQRKQRQFYSGLSCARPRWRTSTRHSAPKAAARRLAM